MTASSRVLFVLATSVAFLISVVPLASSAATYSVSMTPTTFSPAHITVNVGDTVVWTNTDSMAHTVTATDNSFNSGTMQAGQVYSRTFTTPGTYSYHCLFHGAPGGVGMSGTVTVVASSVPSSTQNPTASDLQAQAQALLLKIQQLQQQLAAGGTVPVGGAPYVDSSTCPLIGRILWIGSRGDDVTRLQQFLARDPSVYPEALITGYYGTLTEAAVRRWQVKFNIVSSGNPQTTGYGQVGPRTAAAMSLQCSTSGGGGGGTAPSVGGFIRVTPVSGNAPLTVSVEATVNTVNSCAGATYTIDYGDNTAPSQVFVPSGRCTQMTQTFGHTYQYGGTYQVALSAGAHRTTATVVVAGSAAPPPGATADSISANPSSGQAPLSITFSGIINGSRTCGSGTYTVDFGDGQTVAVPYPDGCQAHSFSVSHQYTAGGTFNARLFRGSQTSGTPAASASVSITGVPAPNLGPFSVTPGVDGDLKKVKVDFDIASTCSGYDMNWGDGIATTVAASPPCTQAVTSRSLTHTYSQAGSYTVTLVRGSRTDTAAITIASF